MSNEQIICLNGKECVYNPATCRFYEGTAEAGKCFLESAKNTNAPTTTTRVEAPPEPASNVISPHRTFGSLKPGDKSSKDNKINIKGTLKYDPIQREANTREGPKNVANALLEDETGQLSIAFWGDVACGDIMQYVKGDKLYIDNLYKVNEPYEGVLKADAGKYFKMAKIN